MLGTRMSNQDEDEVEDELEALQAQVSGISLPHAPVNAVAAMSTNPTTTSAPTTTDDQVVKENGKDRAARRARERQQEMIPAS